MERALNHQLCAEAKWPEALHLCRMTQEAEVADTTAVNASGQQVVFGFPVVIFVCTSKVFSFFWGVLQTTQKAPGELPANRDPKNSTSFLKPGHWDLEFTNS